jgi:hypothetical protein
VDLSPTGIQSGPSTSFITAPNCPRGDGMITKAEQYRRYGEKALASAKQAICEEEKAELLTIAETWFELAREESDMAGTPQSTSNAS